jgi:hypothetical protein
VSPSTQKMRIEELVCKQSSPKACLTYKLSRSVICATKKAANILKTVTVPECKSAAASDGNLKRLQP